MAINVRSVFQVASLCVNFINEEGTITILSGAAGMKPSPLYSTFSVSKAMVNMFIKCAALELAYRKIRVNGVAPGLTWGKSGQAFEITDKPKSKQDNEIFFDLYSKNIPLEAQGDIPISENPNIVRGVYNDDEDVAQAMIWLASDDASFCSGEIMLMDGGYELTSANYPSYYESFVLS